MLRLGREAIGKDIRSWLDTKLRAWSECALSASSAARGGVRPLGRKHLAADGAGDRLVVDAMAFAVVA